MLYWNLKAQAIDAYFLSAQLHNIWVALPGASHRCQSLEWRRMRSLELSSTLWSSRSWPWGPSTSCCSASCTTALAPARHFSLARCERARLFCEARRHCMYTVHLLGIPSCFSSVGMRIAMHIDVAKQCICHYIFVDVSGTLFMGWRFGRGSTSCTW